MTVYFQAGAGHPDLHARRAARSISTRWSAPTPTRCSNGPTSWRARLRGDPALRDVASEAQEGGLRVQCRGRPRTGRPARRLHAERQRHAQRRLRPAADLDHLRPGQPVPRDPGSAAALSAGSRRAVASSMSPAPAPRPARRRPSPTPRPAPPTPTPPPRPTRSPASNQVPLSAFARFEQHLGAARDRAPGAVSVRHHQLQSARPATR